MTTIETIDAYKREQEASYLKWAKLLDALVAGKVADARAHAGRALTNALKDAPAGRATIAQARNSVSYQAATNRLIELVDAASGIIAQANMEIYRKSFAWHREHVPFPIRSVTTTPTQANLNRAASLVVHGQTVRNALTATRAAMAQSLLSTLAIIGTRGLAQKAAHEMLDDWERTTLRDFGGKATTLLSDSQILVERKAGRDVVQADLLHDDPSLPS